jgi:hypothetical protein
MQISSQRSQRRRRLFGVVALSAVVALVAAALTTDTIDLFPPKLKSSEPRVAAASTHVFVDSPRPSIVHRQALLQDVDTLVKHAELAGRVMVSPPGLKHVARRAGIDVDQIAGVAPANFGPRALTEPASEERANEIRQADLPYRIEVQGRPTTPIIDIYTQAPTTAEATRLANAGVQGLRDYLRGLARKQNFKDEEPLTLRQLGVARGAVVNDGAPLVIAMLSFTVAFVLCCGALLGVIHLRRRRLAESAREPDAPPEPQRRALGAAAGDWPRTSRVLPWMLAVFIAVLWLTPFNSIELSAALPIDLKLDRLVLPFIAVTWALALAVGGRAAPRLRLTWIHAALGLFVLCAFLSVIINAHDLNQALEFDLSIKKLPLLVAYVSLFVIVASGVRRSEVWNFLNYTLVLAVICAVGILFEHRFKQNLFYDLSDKFFPSFFSVGEAEAAAVDEAGRRLVRGPAGVPLEAVAMLSMALPIAMVGLLQVQDWRRRLLYGAAACLLLAATLATYRKSALLAPISVVLTLAYFRRQELLRLAPLALLLVVVIQVLAPGALRMTTSQFDPNQLGVPTVNDRAVDYDAVRPDIWTHLPIGRGWGSYEPTGHRILDTELLHRTIEMGVIGLVAYLLIGLSVVLTVRKAIASRDPDRAPVALAGAAAAVSFMVVSALFDVLSFPHATYIFLYMAGMVAVVTARAPEPKERRVARTHAPTERRARRGTAVRRLPTPAGERVG